MSAAEDVQWQSPQSPDGECVAFAVGGGEAVAYSCESPDKTSGNEDTVGIFSYGPGAAVLAVADGAGGLPAGRKASQTAVETLGKALRVSAENTQLLRSAVLNGIEAANQAIIEQANGSATTLTVVTIEGRAARSFHIGDSVAVVVGQRGAIKFQTVSHSPVGFAIEAGFLNEREAMYHVDRNVVSNFLGTSEMRIDVSAEVTLAARDTVMISSDGLSDNLHAAEINERIRVGPLQDALNKLIDLAHHRMKSADTLQPSKPDDLSILLFRKVPARRARAPQAASA